MNKPFSIPEIERSAPAPFRRMLLVSTCLAGSSFALDGGNPVFATIPTGRSSGWKTFEIISGNDTLGTVAEEGFVWTAKHNRWDGLGAYLHDSTTLRLFINHEAGADSTFSRVDLNLANLETWIASGIPNNNNTNQVAAPGPIVKAVSQGWITVGSGTNPINNPCSGNVWPADTFGPGRGFADPLYLTGEETFNNSGNFWVMDVATRTLYKAPDLGGGSWENGTIIDTGRTDTVAILLSSDNGASATGTAPLRLYVGKKYPEGDFLQRNGFTNGVVYQWDPDTTTSTNGTMGGIFSGGNGTTIAGTWVIKSPGAALFSKSEDIHTNMNPLSEGYGVEAVLASQNQAVFKIDFSQLDFVYGALGVFRKSNIKVLFQAGTQGLANDFSGMDNLVWASDGMVYVNEDDGEGDIWKIDVAGLEAAYATGDFTPDDAHVLDIMDSDFVSESSGIIEISDYVGYQPGSVFLTNGQSSTLPNNQVALLVAPGAALKVYSVSYSAGTGGSVSGTTTQNVEHGSDATLVTAVPATGYAFASWSDGVLTASRTDLDLGADLNVTANFTVTSNFLVWTSTYPTLADPDPTADPDFDGIRNLMEYACNLDPTDPNTGTLVAGTGTSGLPLVEVRAFGPAKRLVVEYLRRIDVNDLTYTPQFGSDLLDAGWGGGGTEIVTPVDDDFERVVVQDTVDFAGTVKRFARLKVEIPAIP